MYFSAETQSGKTGKSILGRQRVKVIALWQSVIKILSADSFYLFQKEGKSSTRAENISSLPTSISQERNHFPGADICEKFSEGPTSPNPGPIFISAEITELIAV
jgi:hypothetical protein